MFIFVNVLLHKTIRVFNLHLKYSDPFINFIESYILRSLVHYTLLQIIAIPKGIDK